MEGSLGGRYNYMIEGKAVRGEGEDQSRVRGKISHG
jgi:hypothetical protein